jgi:hypothetical protein
VDTLPSPKKIRNRKTQVERICRYCAKPFHAELGELNRGRAKYCSRDCSAQDRRIPREERTCLGCGKAFFAISAEIKRGSGKCCSVACRNTYVSNKSYSVACVICGKDIVAPPSHHQRRHSVTCSKECSRIRRRETQLGEKSHLWKGGKTEQTVLDRTTLPYKIWREAVFLRDDFTCRMCGQKGVRLACHHIKRYSLFPESRFDVGNGITLCWTCHTGIHWREEEYEEDFFAITGGLQ